MVGKTIEGTKKTPEVYLGPEGVIKIWGRSISEDARGFFEPIHAWIEEYLKLPAESTNVEITLEYFNSASAKQIIFVLQKLLLLNLQQKKLNVSWYYEEGDDDILEKGEYFSTVLNMKFNFVELS